MESVQEEKIHAHFKRASLMQTQYEKLLRVTRQRNKSLQRLKSILIDIKGGDEEYALLDSLTKKKASLAKQIRKAEDALEITRKFYSLCMMFLECT